MAISSTQEIVEELRAGRMVILVDEEDRENEGDLVLAADFVTDRDVRFDADERTVMNRHARMGADILGQSRIPLFQLAAEVAMAMPASPHS